MDKLEQLMNLRGKRVIATSDADSKGASFQVAGELNEIRGGCSGKLLGFKIDGGCEDSRMRLVEFGVEDVVDIDVFGDDDPRIELR